MALTFEYLRGSFVQCPRFCQAGFSGW